MAMWASVLPALLAGLALTLSGCGGGGGKVDQTPPKLMSQTCKGPIDVDTTVNGTTENLKGQIGIFLDADTMQVRTSQTMDPQKIGPLGLMSTATDMIFDPSKKRITVFVNATVKGKSIVNCTVMQLPPVTPDAATMKQLIDTQLKQLKPVKDLGNGVREFQIDRDIPQLDAKVDATVDLDSGSVLKKFTDTQDMDYQGTKGQMVIRWTATTASAGIPDAKNFQVPTSWGKCEPSDEVPEFSLLRSHYVLQVLTGAMWPESVAARPNAALVV